VTGGVRNYLAFQTLTPEFQEGEANHSHTLCEQSHPVSQKTRTACSQRQFNHNIRVTDRLRAPPNSPSQNKVK
jgi:hypothetical protein